MQMWSWAYGGVSYPNRYTAYRNVYYAQYTDLKSSSDLTPVSVNSHRFKIGQKT